MRFFCTAGKGTEKFAYKELSDQNFDLTSLSEGRVYFQGFLTDIDKILQLKSVERAFALVCHKDADEYKELDRATLLHFIRSSILNPSIWKDEELLSLIKYIKSKYDQRMEGEVTFVGENDRPVKKRRCDEKTSFRVSCKCSGICGRKISSQLLAKQIGVKLSQMMKWNVDFRDPDIEICIQINDSHVNVGIPLTRIPLSKREYVRFHGLRGPVTWIMTSLLKMETWGTLLDPMCGKATILLEAAKTFEGVFCIGCDINSDQLKLAHENIKFANVENHLQLVHGDCTALPLRNNSVDNIVCDTPFGKKFSLNQSLTVFHASLLREMHRVLRVNGRIVLLVSEELHCIFQNAEGFTSFNTKLHVLKSGTKVITKNEVPQNSNERDTQLKNTIYNDVKDSHAKDIPKYELDIQSKDSLHIVSNKPDPAHFPHKSPEVKGQEFIKDQPVQRSSGQQHRTDIKSETESNESVLVAGTGCGTGEAGDKDEDDIVNLLSVLKLFEFESDHYIKLGETHSFIIVLKIKNKI